jgi:hypothetical protein
LDDLGFAGEQAVDEQRSTKWAPPRVVIESRWSRRVHGKLPEDHVIGCMIAVGKAVKPAAPKGGQPARAEAVVEDRLP